MDRLPPDCTRKIVSLTSPPDACRFSTVCSCYKSDADSDDVWEKFLPQDYRNNIEKSSDPLLIDRFSLKKDLYLYLSDNPLLIDDGRKSFSLVKPTGKIRYMLSPRDLHIVWSCTPHYWAWVPDFKSRFAEVAELLEVCWLEIGGKIRVNVLSKGLLYGVYFVFQFARNANGFKDLPVVLSVEVMGRELGKKKVCLVRTRRGRRGPRVEATYETKEREDGLLEVEMGEFLNDFDCDSEEVEMWVREIEDGWWKRGLVVHGVDIRPK